jgi:hypothetical protein
MSTVAVRYTGYGGLYPGIPERERLLTRAFEMSNQFADRVVLQTNSRANWALMVNCRTNLYPRLSGADDGHLQQSPPARGKVMESDRRCK